MFTSIQPCKDLPCEGKINVGSHIDSKNIKSMAYIPLASATY